LRSRLPSHVGWASHFARERSIAPGMDGVTRQVWANGLKDRRADAYDIER